jgi:hypothetical protein
MYVALVPFISSIVGGLIVAAASYLLTEKSQRRDRQLDLYKLVYPEKMKAALDLNEIASETFMDLRPWFLGAQNRDEATRIGGRLDQLLWRAKSYEFVLGGNIVQLASDYRLVCIRAFLRADEHRDLRAVSRRRRMGARSQF